MRQKKQILKIIIVLTLLLIPTFALARGLVPCGGDAPEKPCTVLDIFYLIARLTNWLISVAGLYAFYLIVNHGFWMVVSMGDEEAITKRKKGLSGAVVGFVFVLFAYMFVNTAVNYILGPGLTGGKNPNPKCKLDLTSPWTYLTLMDPNKPGNVVNECSNIAH